MKYELGVSMSFVCNTCSNSFTRKSSILRHILTSHKPQKPGKQRTKIKCYYCGCDFVYCVAYDTHLALSHNVEIKTEKLSFSNADEFSLWKENEERLSKSNFVHKHGHVTKCGGYKVERYLCNRRGFYQNKNRGLRMIRTKGTCKAGLSCSARIIASINVKDGSLEVTYYSTHIGHTHQFCHLKLPPSQERLIADRIAEGVTLDRILEEIREEAIVTNGREKKHFMTRKNLENIRQKYSLRDRGKYHHDDEVSVDLFVEECAKLVHSPVLLYKKQGDSEAVMYIENNSIMNNISSGGIIAIAPDVKKSPILDVMDVDEMSESVFNIEHSTSISMTLGIDEFMLVIMTKAQGEMLKKFGSSTILINSTHGTNTYEVQLTTLVILDEYGEGFPVAFCLSTEVNITSMKLFFEVIKIRIGTIETETFMSDDANYYYDAWKETMSAVKYPILCKWHIDRAWKRKLKSIPDKKTQCEVYATLQMLMEEPDVQEFEALLPLFLQKLKEGKYNDFYNYFLTTYANRPTAWASCYRTDAFLNTNTALEDFHRALKRVYSKSQKNKRLDILINKVFAVIRDKFYKRLIQMEEGHVNYRINDINKRHHSSADVTNITEISMNEWRIIAVGTKNMFYSVLKEVNSCECKLKCLLCKACIHMYSCNCHDYLVKHNLCKHIHAAIQFHERKTVLAVNNAVENLVNEKDYGTDEVFEENALQYPTPLNDPQSIFLDKLNRCIQLASQMSSAAFNTLCFKKNIMKMVDDLLNDLGVPLESENCEPISKNVRL